MQARAAKVLFPVLLGLFVFECGFEWVLRHSVLLHLPSNSLFRAYYMEFDRHILSYMPSCAVYDKELAYLLKPGTCRFTNREFDVQLDINHVGLRDSEAALSQPEVIVLGDSYAMGWGVAQDETFPKLLEKTLGQRVLDAGVPSYGTVRELQLLQRLDRSRLKYIVIQYCNNDLEENRKFLDNQNVLPIMSQEKYEGLVAEHQQSVRYYPLKYARYFLQSQLARVQRHLPWGGKTAPTALTTAPAGSLQEADALIKVLLAHSASFEGVKLVVVGINDINTNTSAFPDALKKAIAAGGQQYPAFLRDAQVVDVSAALGVSSYFTLDDHLTSHGHVIVARELAKAINGRYL